ncbi:MAG: efflux RND transporter permease subunit [Treponema sp.]|jgi:multidrug efflux pump subunit AcrB|nr:efflux RND transporter permease subunit [Treponema sp.]
MIKKLIRFSACHPLSVLSVLGGLVMLGITCVFVIPLDFLPLMEERFLIVGAEYPGVTAEEMRTMVTIPLEDAFAALGGLKSLSSVSREGLSLLRIELHWGIDTDLALAESREIIDLCYEGLPSFCSKPKVSRESGNGKDSITIILVPMDGDLRYGRYIAETDIKPRLQRLGGAAGVTVSGGEEEEIHVRFQKSGLESRGLDLSSAAGIIAAANFEYPGGTIREGDLEYTVKTSGLYRNLEELKNTPLSWDQGSLLRVGDIAEVERKSGRRDSFFLYRSAGAGISRAAECIRIGVRKGQDSPPLPLSRQVKKEIENLALLYSPWYRFEIAEDLSDQIVESLRSLLFSALAAVLSAGLVVFIFLRSVKLSLVVTGVIPLSALAAVLSLAISGRSLNLMSLSGMAIGIGMVIDAGVVAVEQIDGELRTWDGARWPEPVIRGAGAVALSSGASALSTVIVFVPIFVIPGLLGELFSDLAAAVISSISFSCLLSFTYIPAVVSLMKPKTLAGESGRLTGGLEARYRRILRFLFRRPRFALLPLGACLAAGLLCLGLSEFTLLPELPGSSVSFELSFPAGTALEKMRRVALELSRGLEEIKEIEALEISGGLEKDDYPRLVQPAVIPEKIRFTAHGRGKGAALRDLIAAHFTRTPYIPAFGGGRDILAEALNMGDAENLVRGESPAGVRAAAEALLAELEGEGGAEQFPGAGASSGFAPHAMRTSSAFIPDRLALARFSLNAQYVAQIARDVLEGIRESYYEGGRELPLVIKLREEDLRSPQELGETMVSIESGAIPLRFLGGMEEEQGEAALYRYNRRDAKVFSFPLPRALGEQFSVLSPKGEETEEMIRTGLVLLAITLVLLYLSMGAQFESFLIPLILLLAIPPSFAGAFILLLVTGVKPDINSMIALVVLFGISINNSILLYESCVSPAAADRGMRIPLIIRNCSKKLRAILITNITTLAALIPFAFDPFAVNTQASLSIALLGGLSLSLVLVLLIVPLCIAFTGRKK